MFESCEHTALQNSKLFDFELLFFYLGGCFLTSSFVCPTVTGAVSSDMDVRVIPSHLFTLPNIQLSTA